MAALFPGGAVALLLMAALLPRAGVAFRLEEAALRPEKVAARPPVIPAQRMTPRSGWGRPTAPQSKDRDNSKQAHDGVSEAKIMWDGRMALHHHVRDSDQNKTSCPGNSTGKVAVCIVGQLSRLEVTTKIAHVLEPLSASGVDAFVVLEQNSNVFSNGIEKACNGQRYSHDDVPRLLEPWYKEGLYVMHEDFLPNISHFPKYGTDKPLNRTVHLGRDFQQWSHLAACAELVQHREHQTGCKYESVIKLRDNTIAWRDIALHEVRGDDIVVKNCAGWGGLSDKVMVAPWSLMDSAFRGCLAVARAILEGNDPELMRLAMLVVNPEQMLKKALEFLGVPVLEHGLPLVDGRCVLKNGSENVWCIVPAWKDCHPENTTISNCSGMK